MKVGVPSGVAFMAQPLEGPGQLHGTIDSQKDAPHRLRRPDSWVFPRADHSGASFRAPRSFSFEIVTGGVVSVNGAFTLLAVMPVTGGNRPCTVSGPTPQRKDVDPMPWLRGRGTPRGTDAEVRRRARDDAQRRADEAHREFLRRDQEDRIRRDQEDARRRASER